MASTKTKRGTGEGGRRRELEEGTIRESSSLKSFSMQTSRKSCSRNGLSEVPQKTSTTRKITRQTSLTGSESDSPASMSPVEKGATIRSRKLESKAPRSPASEKKHLNRMAELESRLCYLQNDLKKTKDQLASSESQKKSAQKEAEEVKKHLAILNQKLEDSECELQELVESEDERIQDLRKLGQERDRAWQSELEAVRKQHLVDSAALMSVINEIQRLRVHCKMLVSSEATNAKRAEMADSELHCFKKEMAEKAMIIENLKTQIAESDKLEAKYQELINVTHLQLVIARGTIETLQADGVKLLEYFGSAVAELEESQAKICLLEETVRKLEQNDTQSEHCSLISEPSSLQSEFEHLKSALAEAKIRHQEEQIKRHQEEQIKSTMQIQSAYEAVECMKTESLLRQAELECAMKEKNAEVAELNANLVDKEIILQCLSSFIERLEAEKEIQLDDKKEFELEAEPRRSNANIVDLKASLLEKETVLQNIAEENDRQSVEIKKKQAEWIQSGELALTELGTAKAADQEALTRLRIASEEADGSNKQIAVMGEQLEAVQAANSEMEVELRRLRVQADQWKKAAEVAMAIFTSGKNGRLIERTGSFDSDCHLMMNSPFLDEVEAELPKKKNIKMLRKIGVLLKKSQR